MKTFQAHIAYDDAYVQPLIVRALESRLESGNYTLHTSPRPNLESDIPLLSILPYESLDFTTVLADPTPGRYLINAYVIRKALIRKHYLASTINAWVTKNPSSCLRRRFPQGVDFELDYAEFLDESLLEAYELTESFARNAQQLPNAREWWILKPSMSDRGNGIRLFSSEDELQGIFEEWEPDEDEDEDEDDSSEQDEGADRIMTSHLRHFVAQPYIHPPLLIADSPFSNRKFHIRTYVVAVGALRVYVYKEMLALFAAELYAPPWSTEEESDRTELERMRAIHLTNTCVQTSTDSKSTESTSNSIHLLKSLPLAQAQHKSITSQIDNTVAEVFQAALAQSTNFQPLPQSFEIFGLDFLVAKTASTDDVTVHLLEVNAFPDFAQTGPELRDKVVLGLFQEIFEIVVGPYFGTPSVKSAGSNEELRLHSVLNIDLKRR